MFDHIRFKNLYIGNSHILQFSELLPGKTGLKARVLLQSSRQLRRVFARLRHNGCVPHVLDETETIVQVQSAEETEHIHNKNAESRVLAHRTHNSVCPNVLVRHRQKVQSRRTRLLLRHKHSVLEFLHRHLLIETVRACLFSSFILLTSKRAHEQNET